MHERRYLKAILLLTFSSYNLTFMNVLALLVAVFIVWIISLHDSRCKWDLVNLFYVLYLLLLTLICWLCLCPYACLYDCISSDRLIDLFTYLLSMWYFAVWRMAGGVILQLLRRKLQSQSTVSFAPFQANFVLLDEFTILLPVPLWTKMDTLNFRRRLGVKREKTLFCCYT